MTQDVQTRIWELLDIKDIVMKEHGIKPVFNDMYVCLTYSPLNPNN